MCFIIMLPTVSSEKLNRFFCVGKIQLTAKNEMIVLWHWSAKNVLEMEGPNTLYFKILRQLY